MENPIDSENPPHKETEKPKAFLALKFDSGAIEESQKRGESLITVLEEAGLEVSCLVKDEEWGKYPKEHPILEAFERIKQSNLLIVDASGETGFGMGAEAGYAKALGKKVIMVCSEGTSLKLTRTDVSDEIVQYKDLGDLSQKLKPLVMGLEKPAPNVGN